MVGKLQNCVARCIFKCLTHKVKSSHISAKFIRSSSTNTFQNKYLEGRVALVTGSTSGIGLGIARGLAARGSSIILNGFGDDTLISSLREEFNRMYHCDVAHLSTDLSIPGDIEKMVRDIRDLHPAGVDILVNNAVSTHTTTRTTPGFQHVCPVEDFSIEKWNAMIAVMLSAPFQLIKYLLPDMKRQGWGRIINMSSAHGHVASANKSAYVSAKHGILGLTKVVALETAGSGVTCNALCPGYVNTPILQSQVETLAEKEGCSYEEAEGKFLSNFHATKEAVRIDHLADAVAFMCSEGTRQMTGSSITIDGGWTAK